MEPIFRITQAAFYFQRTRPNYGINIHTVCIRQSAICRCSIDGLFLLRTCYCKNSTFFPGKCSFFTNVLNYPLSSIVHAVLLQNYFSLLNNQSTQLQRLMSCDGCVDLQPSHKSNCHQEPCKGPIMNI